MTNTKAYMVVIERSSSVQPATLSAIYGSLESAMLYAEDIISTFGGSEEKITCYFNVQVGCAFMEGSRYVKNVFRFLSSGIYYPIISVFEIEIRQ